MGITTFDIICLIASIASLALAIIAIWLSFKFFYLSTIASDKTARAAEDISSSVSRLEKLFDKMYSDTFSIVKDTYSDMRSHVWNTEGSDNKLENELTQKAEYKIYELKEDLTRELTSIFLKQDNTDTKIDSLKNDISSLIDRAVAQARTVELEAKEETLREYITKIYNSLKKTKKRILIDHIVDRAIEDNVNIQELIEEIQKMKVDGLVDFEGSNINNGIVEIKLKI